MADLSITVRVMTDNTIPDPQQIAQMIPAAFAQLDSEITVRQVTVELTPVHYTNQATEFPNAEQPPAQVPPSQ